ncbi:hypothetical protein GCM10027174_04210 [Salinifilum aidingensis]
MTTRSVTANNTANATSAVTASETVTTSDGVRLQVYERGDPAHPVVLAVHGYPDDHAVWDGVLDVLADSHRVVSYDVRGAGDSDPAAPRDGYALDRLERDVAAVADAVSPHRPVHLLGHDWGSIQAWHAVTGRRMRGRIASFTSVSGPCLDHAAHWFRARLRRPAPRHLRELARQLLRSTYLGFFQLPLLPELAWRTRVLPRVIRLLEPAPGEQEGTTGGSGMRPRTRDGVRGLELYRANVRRRLTGPQDRPTDVPTQVIAPTGDPFVTVALQTDIARWAPRAWVRHVPGGHWLPRTRPALVASCARQLIERVETGARGAWTPLGGTVHSRCEVR